MSVAKKYQWCIVVAFFLMLFPVRQLPADEKQSPESTAVQDKKDIPLTIKGTNISIVPATGESNQPAANKEKTAVSGEQPRLVMDSTEFDAGEVWEGEDIIHPFTVKNTGKGLLEIKNVKAGWGCTVASFDKAIPPGQEGKVTIKITTGNKRGSMKQSATIYSNDPQQPTAVVTLTGNIKPYLSIMPSPRIILQGYSGDMLEQKVVITSMTDEPFAITEVTSTLEDKIAYKLATEKKDKEYSLTVKTLSGLEEPFRGNIILKTTHQKKPDINLTVMASLHREVKVAPEYLYFGIIDTGKKVPESTNLERTAVISKVQADDLTIKNIETSKDWITAKATTDEAGKQYTLTVTLDRNKLPKGTFRETVTIQVQYKGKTEAARLIVEGKVL